MANNCLVESLKKNIPDDSLAKRGELRGLWKFASSGYNFLNFTTVAGQVVSCTNLTAFLTDGGTERTNPFTTINNGFYLIKPNVTNDQEGWFSILPRFGLKSIILSNMSRLNVSVEDILEYNTDLTGIGFYKTEISGDLMSIANYDGINSIKLCLLSKSMVKELNVRNFINAIAARRANGTSLTMAASAIDGYDAMTDIPVGLNGTSMTAYCTIYFTSDTTTYPHGWYVKATNNKYYNANDEEIPAP